MNRHEARVGTRLVDLLPMKAIGSPLVLAALDKRGGTEGGGKAGDSEGSNGGADGGNGGADGGGDGG